MKLYSKFRDYYDIGIQYGVDPAVVYQRITHETHYYNKGVAKEDKPLVKLCKELSGSHQEDYYYRDFLCYDVGGRSAGGDLFRVSVKLLCCCGELIPLADIYTYGWCKEKVKRKLVGIDEIIEFEKTYGKPLGTADWNSRYRIETILDKVKGLNTDEVCLSMGSPLIMVDGGRIIVNPKLESHEVYRLIDAFTMFNKISAYISNKMNNVEQPVDVSDKDMAVMKGFNDKSFRKEKGKKKPRKG